MKFTTGLIALGICTSIYTCQARADINSEMDAWDTFVATQHMQYQLDQMRWQQQMMLDELRWQRQQDEQRRMNRP